jgi:hypothetical protein
MTLEAAQEALAAARREAAAHRTENAALKKAQADAETAKLSDLDKATKKAADLEVKLAQAEAASRERINRYEVQIAAAKLGIIDPEAAVKLLDWESLEYEADGSPKGLDKALAALTANRPWLVGTPAPQAGATNPARGHAQGQMTMADVKKLTRQQVAAMNPEQRAQMYAAMARG